MFLRILCPRFIVHCPLSSVCCMRKVSSRDCHKHSALPLSSIIITSIREEWCNLSEGTYLSKWRGGKRHWQKYTTILKQYNFWNILYQAFSPTFNVSMCVDWWRRDNFLCPVFAADNIPTQSSSSLPGGGAYSVPCTSPELLRIQSPVSGIEQQQPATRGNNHCQSHRRICWQFQDSLFFPTLCLKWGNSKQSRWI